MTYVFSFLGEFGYELLSWQGIVRRFASTISPEDRIVCCSRADLYPFYETAHLFVDMTEVPLYKKSLASAYYALASPVYDFHSPTNRLYDRRLRREVGNFVLARLRTEGVASTPSTTRFVFSSEPQVLNGCVFGTRQSPYDPEYDIYDHLDLANNVFRKIEPDLRARPVVEEKLGWSLDEPFILCQTRTRSAEVPAGSKDTVPHDRFIDALSRDIKVVMLSFETGRALDSFSAFGARSSAVVYPCRSFTEQACLIWFARHCVFFTEGDFGSHTYVPPFLGRDVTAVAPWTVFQLGTTPIDFWNENVFRFGGRILPMVSEEVFASDVDLTHTVECVLERSAGTVPQQLGA